MQIYFGNIRIDVSINISKQKFIYNQNAFLNYLKDSSASEFNITLLDEESLHSFCMILVTNWNNKLKVLKVLNLFINSASDLLACFSKYLKIVHACGGVVINDKNELLLIQRMGLWDLPKGKLEKGESYEQCAIREVKEETGVEGSVMGFLLNTYHVYDTYGELCLKITHWYEMKYNSGSLSPQIEEAIDELKWVASDELTTYRAKTYKSLLSVFDML